MRQSIEVKMILTREFICERITAQFGEAVCNECMERLRTSDTYNYRGYMVVIHGQFDKYYIIASQKYKKLFNRG